MRKWKAPRFGVLFYVPKDDIQGVPWYNLCKKFTQFGGICMLNRCIFCGRELTRFQKKKLYCGNTNQILCGDCHDKYKSLSAVERAEAAYQTGRAENAAELREYLNTVRLAREEKEAAAAARAERRISNLKCMRCDGAMQDYGPFTFKLGEETYFFSDLNRFLSGSLTMHLLRCSSCGKVEFFIPDAQALEELKEE